MVTSVLARSVRRVVTLQKHAMSAGFSAFRMAEADLRTDPVLNVDHFFMSVPTFPPHPHAGFSAVTYLLEDSPGSVLNRDSFGDRTMILPGDIHWTTAGKGVVHEEIPSETGITCHGLQIFVNLSASNKTVTARADHLSATDVPLDQSAPGVRARVLSGSCNGTSSPLHPVEPFLLLDVTMEPGAEFKVDIPKEHNVFIMHLQGEAQYGAKQTQVTANQVCDFESDGDGMLVKGSGESNSQFVLFAGKPLNQPSVWRGPFNGISQSQINEFVRDYQSGKMGSLPS